MKVNLLFREGESYTTDDIPWNNKDLERDLDLEILFDTMAAGDPYIRDVCRKTILNSLKDQETILWRQDVLRDAINNQNLVREIYTTIVETVNQAKKQLFWIDRSGDPEFVIHESINLLKLYFKAIERVREMGRGVLPLIRSQGFRQLFDMLLNEFDQEYVGMISEHLRNLGFPRGIPVRGGLGMGNSLTGYTLIVPETRPDGIVKRIANLRDPHYTYVVPERDESGARALGDMRARSLRETADIVSESAENVLSFISRLREAIAFLLGCINLWNVLKSIGVPVSFPVPRSDAESGIHYEDLYSVTLCLRIHRTPVENSLNVQNDSLIFITGANRGGKSTLLRAMGQAQMMMQAGMFVAAQSFSTSIASGIFTHFKREEDSGMTIGKLDEELKRMSEIIEHVVPGSRIFFNESFSSTNVREGSDIAIQVINALLAKRMKIIFVTHFNELAEAYVGSAQRPTFLRAERLQDGTRTFKVLQAEPIPTSFGYDIFLRVFGKTDEFKGINQLGNPGKP